MINNPDNVGQEVVRLLRDGGHHDAAQQIENLVERLLVANQEESPGLVKAIIHRCHPKWLGDLNVQTVSWEAWMKLLSDLAKQANKLGKTGLRGSGRDSQV